MNYLNYTNIKIVSLDSRIGRQSNLFKHHIIEWQSRGVIPNSDYLITQRKMKRVKSEMIYPSSSISTNQQVNPINDYELSQMTSVNQSSMGNSTMSAHNLIQNHCYATGMDYQMNVDYTNCSQFNQYNNINNGFNAVNNINTTTNTTTTTNNNNYYTWNNNSDHVADTNRIAPVIASNQLKPQIQQPVAPSIEVSYLNLTLVKGVQGHFDRPIHLCMSVEFSRGVPF